MAKWIDEWIHLNAGWAGLFSVYPCVSLNVCMFFCFFHTSRAAIPRATPAMMAAFSSTNCSSLSKQLSTNWWKGGTFKQSKWHKTRSAARAAAKVPAFLRRYAPTRGCTFRRRMFRCNTGMDKSYASLRFGFGRASRQNRCSSWIHSTGTVKTELLNNINNCAVQTLRIHL